MLEDSSPKKPQTESVQKAFQYTGHIKILGKGKSEIGERFVKLGINGEDGYVEVHLRTDEIGGKGQAIDALNRIGAALISPEARKELITRIQALGPTKTRFTVATRIGFHGNEYVLPDRVISAERSRLGICLDPSSATFASKYRVSQSKDWTDIPKLARGNSRFMASVAHGFVGPCVNIMDLEQIGLELVGPAETGKSSIAVAVGSIWGRHVDPNRAREHGFAETWNNTAAKFEPIALAHNHAYLIVDETRMTVIAVILDSIMRWEKAAEKGRQTDITAARSWSVPFLSTSNKSLDQMCQEAGIELDDAYRGRLIDIGPPENASGVFEDLHGYADVAALSVRLKELAAECYGWPSRRFIRKLVDWHARDAAGLRKWFDERRQAYLKRAQAITAPGRQLNRIHQKFATIYAAGCLAVEFKIFRWPKKELRQALLKCERDHVKLVALHIKHPTTPAQTPLDSLLAYIRANRHRFVDLDKMAAGELVADQDPNLGYSHGNKGNPEFLFTEATVEAIAGGKRQALALKQELDRRHLIGTTKAGKQATKFVVRRHLSAKPGDKGERTWLLAIDAKILDIDNAGSPAPRERSWAKDGT